MAERKRSKPRPYARATRAKARKAALAIFEGATQAEAMRQAGYSDAEVASRHKSSIEAIRAEFNRLLDDRIPAELIVSKIMEGLNAERSVVVPGGKEPATVIKEPDHYVRVKVLDLLARMRGLIVRHVEGKVTHEVDVAKVVSEARRRVACLPEYRPDVTATVTSEAIESQNEQVKSAAYGSSAQHGDGLGEDDGINGDEKAKS